MFEQVKDPSLPMRCGYALVSRGGSGTSHMTEGNFACVAPKSKDHGRVDRDVSSSWRPHPAAAEPNNNSVVGHPKVVNVDGVLCRLTALQQIADDNGGNRGRR